MPDPERHPNLFGWAAIARKFKDEVQNKWAAGQLQMPAGGVAAAGAAGSAAANQRAFFKGAAADLWESLLSQSGAQWLLGTKPTQADAAAIKELGGLKPNPASHPNLFAWAAMATKFSDAVTGKWAAGDLPRPAEAQAPAKAAPAKKEAPAKAAEKPAAAADDDLGEDDLFGDDPDADAAAEALKKKGEEAKAKKKKAAPVAKSLIVWEVKPWGEETDLTELANMILGIEMDGLFWKTEWKKEPVAYGVFKIVIGATIEDEKVSTDLVAEKIEEFEDHVQSVDILAFNKL